MGRIEVSRTLVKSPPELWAELEGDGLARAVGEVTVRPTDHERKLSWEGWGARGTAVLEIAGWGTKVTLTAELEEEVAELGLLARLRGRRPRPPDGRELERRLARLLEDLGAAHRRPFI